jgi:hypothetical protein
MVAKKQPEMQIIDWTGPVQKPWKEPVALKKKRLAMEKKFPWDCWVNVSYGQRNKKIKEAHKARDEIEKQWSKFGKWVGHGSSVPLGGNNYCDVQVAFKTKADAEKATAIARAVMNKYDVSGDYHYRNVLE